MSVGSSVQQADEAFEQGTFWSVMIPCYRPTGHLRETVLSALASLDMAGLSAQIELVDDGTPLLSLEGLLGSELMGRISVYRRRRNGGLGECWNCCVERARGQFIHLLHQDDCVEPEFYARMAKAALEFPDAGMLFCRTAFIEGDHIRLDTLERDTEGELSDWLAHISSGQRLQCPSVVIPRTTYSQLGGFKTDLRYVIDWEMWIRVAASFPVVYVPDALAHYRIHDANETARLRLSGDTTADFARGLRHIERTLKTVGRLDCLPNARAYALWASSNAAVSAERLERRDAAAREVGASLRYLATAMNLRQVLRQLFWLLRLSISLATPRRRT